MPTHHIEKAGPTVLVDTPGDYDRQFYIKPNLPRMENGPYRDPQIEHRGYQLLRKYFPMPRAHMASSTYGSALIVQGIDATPASRLLLADPEMAHTTVSNFLIHQNRMWSATVENMDETRVARDWRKESLAMANRIEQTETMSRIGAMKMRVNGQEYPSINETLTSCKKIMAVPERHMALCHGDEHTGNILGTRDRRLWVIDPGNYTGFNSPSTAFNNFVGGLYLFEYTYTGGYNEGSGALDISYSIDPEYAVAEKMLRDDMRQFRSQVHHFQGDQSISSELLYINELRVALGMTRRSTTEEKFRRIIDTGLIFAGIATEQYYNGFSQ